MSYEQQVLNGWIAGIIFTAVLLLYFFLSHRDEDYAPTRWTRWKAWVVARYFTSSPPIVPTPRETSREQRSDAVEQAWEQPGTGGWNCAPSLSAELAALTDDQLLEVLALVFTDDGEHRFADSRIAKFIGGRVSDRVDQVRDVRGVAPEPVPPGRLLQVRDAAGERVIPL